MDLTCEERQSDSPFVERIWRSRNESAGTFISLADIHWGIVVTKLGGQTTLTVRGPETKATTAYAPADAEFIGIQFKAGTLMPKFPARTLMDRCDINLPGASSQSFWLNGESWQFPDYENADTFVERLAGGELLTHDPVVNSILAGKALTTLSLRTMQRRFLHATGLTAGAVNQIGRARHATALLKEGLSILDVVERLGYADQPHLTRSLKHYIGQTPAQIADEGREARLSFLFKTPAPV